MCNLTWPTSQHCIGRIWILESIPQIGRLKRLLAFAFILFISGFADAALCKSILWKSFAVWLYWGMHMSSWYQPFISFGGAVTLSSVLGLGPGAKKIQRSHARLMWHRSAASLNCSMRFTLDTFLNTFQIDCRAFWTGVLLHVVSCSTVSVAL